MGATGRHLLPWCCYKHAKVPFGWGLSCSCSISMEFVTLWELFVLHDKIGTVLFEQASLFAQVHVPILGDKFWSGMDSEESNASLGS